MEFNYCIEVHLRNGYTPVFHHFSGYVIESHKKRIGLRPIVRFNIPDHHINAVVHPEMRCLKHLIRLPNASNVTKENFELAPVLLPLFILYMGKKGIRIRPIFRLDNHKKPFTLP